MKRIALVLIASLLVPVAAWALGAPEPFDGEGGQFETATVVGTVKDSSGAVVPSAKVTLTNTQTGVTQERMSDANGSYEFFTVRIGSYVVTAEKDGFSVALVDNVQITVGARQRVDLNMAVGQLSEKVEVSASAVLLQTDSSDRSQVITAEQTKALPLNGREYSALALLSPGVRLSALNTGGFTPREGSFNVNGLRSTFNNFLIDGVDNNAYGTSNQGFSNQVVQASPDAVLITSGSNQWIDLLNEVLLEPGDTVIMELFTYQGAVNRLRKCQVNIVGIPLDGDGMRMDALASTLAGLRQKGVIPKYIYTIPTVQNPTGTIMPVARRQELLRLSQEYGVPIFEDECYADLIWEGDWPQAIRAMDPTNHVIHIGSFSKSLSPSMRLAYFVAPWEVLSRMLACKSDGGTGALGTAPAAAVHAGVAISLRQGASALRAARGATRSIR